jgi:hypothetical protein
VLFGFIAGLRAQEVQVNPPSPVQALTLSDSGRTLRISHADFGNWLTISFSGYKGDDWHPNWTSVVTVYKPIIHKLPYGRWEITFTDLLSEALP